MSNAQPNFFIVGAAKSGTTSLYAYLNQHPEVYMSPIKEPNYFASDIDQGAIREEVKARIKMLNVDEYIKGDMNKTMHRAFITSFDQYLALFRFAKNEKAIGEASASYLFSKTAATNIFQYNSKAKIIVVLRQPVERAYSHYLMDQRMALTNYSFEDALSEEKKHPVRNWGATSLYLELGLYSEQVKRYVDLFPPQQILIILNEDLRQSTEAIMKKVYTFLNVNPNFKLSVAQDFNTAAVPRNPIVRKLITVNTFRVKIRRALKHSFLKGIIKNLLFTKPEKGEMLSETKKQLQNFYDEDIKLLEQLIDKDLSSWKKI